jgi:carbon monoxide dehydrogenase subunit G
VPTTSRTRQIDADRDTAWELVSDPHHLPRWWPKVKRVEHAGPHGWTKVFVTERGRTVRADFTRLEVRRPELVAWRQELEDSPFERVLEEAITEVRLKEAGAATDVTLVLRQRLRGWARFAPFLVRRATRKLLDEALDGVQRCLSG